MFRRIVVGTDGSETAAVAIRHAHELAKASGAALEIVSAYRTPEPGDPAQAYEPTVAEGEELNGPPEDLPRAVDPRENAIAALDAATAEATAAGVGSVNAHPIEGDAADAILDVAEETGADVIVIGSKGMTGAKRFLLGSVPNNVSHHAPCDVLIVRTT